MKTFVAFFVTIAATVSAQDLQPGANFNTAPAKIPQSTSYANHTTFADLDLDGDLDAVMTQGGVFFSLTTRHWRSNATTAFGSFAFTDVTSGTLPLVNSRATHVTPFDIDNDGDFDLLISNSTQFQVQSNAWLVNQGGAQGGAAGNFVLDQTRWTGLGGPGSSIPASLLVNSGTFSGGFADWSQSCSFADVDLDGDYDYLQTSAGPNFNGATMSRMFLNAGGVFSEYNPSGAVSAALSLTAGSSAGWVEGTQLDNTPNVSGASHDITLTTFSVEFADTDNDFDLDVLIQNRNGQSRLFQNRLIENGMSLGNEGAGTRLYRDITFSALTSLQNGNGSMDLQLADLDNDDDLDIWASNYVNFSEQLLMNTAGVFTSSGSPLGDPGSDDNEIELMDFDGDGDLDAAAASFEGVNALYKNSFSQGASPATAAGLMQKTGVLGVESEIASPGTNADSWLSVESGDLDMDGDVDILFAADGPGTNASLQINALGVPDIIAPRVPSIAQLSGPSVASSVPHRIAARAFDNSALSWFRDASAVLNFTVNGEPHSAPATWAGGNIFHATVPGYWFGAIQFSMSVTDRAGNTGKSRNETISVSSAGLSNYGSSNPGCAGTQAISANSAPTSQNSEFEILTTNCPPSAINLLIISDASATLTLPSLGIEFLADPFSTNIQLLDGLSDPSGLMRHAVPISNYPGITGLTFYAQTISNWAGSCTLPPANLSNSDGLIITILP